MPDALFIVCSTAAADGNFVLRFIQAKGGCSEYNPLMNFDYGAERDAPFGKALEEWTGDDLRALKEAMAICVPRPNGFEISNEKEIVRKVATAIEEGRRSRQNRERQAAAARQMAQERAEADIRNRRERARRQEKAAARAELRTFYGHIMSEAERERALQLKATIPTLTEAVDNLLVDQRRLQKEADEQQRRVAEREEAARRIKAEEAKRALQAKRAEQEAQIEAEHKREVCRGPTSFLQRGSAER